jgi:glycosyltransferase involved in cell wall biosynthesis
MLAQDLSGELEILVVDGGSADRTRSLVEEARHKDGRVRLLGNPARRTPQGLNVGLRNARGEFVARMDAHTLYPPDYLRRAVERLHRGDAEHVSGPMLPEGRGCWSRRIAAVLETKLGVGGASYRLAREELEVDTGFTGVWRRDTLVRHGGWDEAWIVNQDAELAARIRKAGGRIVCLPELGARYIPRNSLRALARQYWRYGLYRAKTSLRHPESMRRSHVFPPGLVVTSVLAAVLPRRHARAPRVLVGIYSAAVLVSAGARASSRDLGTRDILALPVVYGTMHVAWGSGFLVGCARWGVPLRAFARLARDSRSGRGAT